MKLAKRKKTFLFLLCSFCREPTVAERTHSMEGGNWLACRTHAGPPARTKRFLPRWPWPSFVSSPVEDDVVDCGLSTNSRHSDSSLSQLAYVPDKNLVAAQRRAVRSAPSCRSCLRANRRSLCGRRAGSSSRLRRASRSSRRGPVARRADGIVFLGGGRGLDAELLVVALVEVPWRDVPTGWGMSSVTHHQGKFILFWTV